MAKRGLDYFGASERPYEKKWSGIRDSVLSPFCTLFIWCGVSPNIVSLIGLSMLIGVAYFFLSNPPLAVLFLILYVVFDGIDGCVARRTKQASSAGALVDILCDQTGMAVVTVLLMTYGFVSGWVGGLYIYAYCIMIAATVLRNVLGNGPRWVIRTKYFLFLVYALWAFGFGEWYSVFFAIALPATILCAITGSIALYWRLKGVR